MTVLNVAIELAHDVSMSLEQNHNLSLDFSLELENVDGSPIRLLLPRVRQQPGFCGPASLVSIAAYLTGKIYTQPEMATMLSCTPEDGCTPDSLVAVARRLGMQAEALNGLSVADVEDQLEQGRCVVIDYQAHQDNQLVPYSEKVDGHYSVVVGSDNESFFLMDPSLELDVGYGVLSKAGLESRWFDKEADGYETNHLGIVIWNPSRNNLSMVTPHTRVLSLPIELSHDVSDEARDAGGKWTSGGNGGGQKQTDTPAFKNWFKDSKVVDDAGKPLVVYHGRLSNDFATFRVPAFFSESRQFAEDYGHEKSQDLQADADIDVVSAYLSLQKPFDPHNEKDLEAVASLLPGKQDVPMANFPMISNSFNKETIIKALKGEGTRTGWGSVIDFTKAKIGEQVPDPTVMGGGNGLYFLGLRNGKAYFASRYASESSRLPADVLPQLDKAIDEEVATGNGRIVFTEQKPIGNSGVFYPEKRDRVIWGKDVQDRLLTGLDNWDVMETPEVMGAIKQLGYDGCVAQEKGKKTFVAFYPEQIKSATKNKGTYQGDNIYAALDLPIELSFNPDQPRDEKGQWVVGATVPPAPGQSPIPAGHVRLYHFTRPEAHGIEPANGDYYITEQLHQVAEKLKREGIDISKAKGSTYGEPDVVWASTQKPEDGHLYAEFSVPADDPRWQIGKPEAGTDPREYEKRNWDSTFSGSIKPEELVAVHEPWHKDYRLFKEEEGGVASVLKGEHDWAVESKSPHHDNFRTAVLKIKSENKQPMDVKLTLQDDVEQAAKNTNTNPTPAQKKVGNYSKGRFHVHNLGIAIENPKGSIRTGTSPNGKPWVSPPFPCHYGYINKIDGDTADRGADSDHVDVYYHNTNPTNTVHVIDQVNPQGKFDEHKVVLNAKNIDHAKQLYLGCYQKGWDGLGAITEMPIAEFKKWLLEGDKSKPISADIEASLDFPVTLSFDEDKHPRDDHGRFSDGAAYNKVINTPAFKDWFGDWTDKKAFSSARAPGLPPVSMAMRDGKPLVLYHGTNKDFDSFEVGRVGTNSTFLGPEEVTRAALFFAENPDDAQIYAEQGKFDDSGRGGITGTNIKPVFLNIKYPLDFTDDSHSFGGNVEDLVAQGMNESWLRGTRKTWELFDGEDGKALVAAAKRAGYDGAMINEENPTNGEKMTVWVAFDPEQIKSASGNRGTFDKSNKIAASLDVTIELAGGWVGVDLDGTLATQDDTQPFDPNVIGEPIPLMIQEIKNRLDNGQTVKILTARVADPKTAESQTKLIQDWTEKYLGARLAVTCQKDPGMTELLDDRARRVIHNTGVVLSVSVDDCIVGTDRIVPIELAFDESQHPRGQVGRFAVKGTEPETVVTEVDLDKEYINKDKERLLGLMDKDVPAEYKSNLEEALEHFTPTAMELLNKNVVAVHTFPSLQVLTQHFVESDPMAKNMLQSHPDWIIGGAYELDHKALALDGKLPDDKFYDAADTYAHELTHALDGPDLTFSNSPEWSGNPEIAKEFHFGCKYGPLTIQNDSAREAFAEVGRVLLHPKSAEQLEQTKTYLPACYKFFKDHGLVA